MGPIVIVAELLLVISALLATERRMEEAKKRYLEGK